MSHQGKCYHNHVIVKKRWVPHHSRIEQGSSCSEVQHAARYSKRIVLYRGICRYACQAGRPERHGELLALLRSLHGSPYATTTTTTTTTALDVYYTGIPYAAGNAMSKKGQNGDQAGDPPLRSCWESLMDDVHPMKHLCVFCVSFFRPTMLTNQQG